MTSINLNPKIWGPHAWFFIDSILLSLPSELDKNLQQQLKNFFISFSVLLPCNICRNHFLKYMNETDLINYDFSNKDKIIIWVNNLHNIIRKSNNSKEISINNMYKYYISKYSNTKNNNYYYLIIIILLILIIILIYNYKILF